MDPVDLWGLKRDQGQRRAQGSVRILSRADFDHYLQNPSPYGISKNCENFSSRPEADRLRQKDSQG